MKPSAPSDTSPALAPPPPLPVVEGPTADPADLVSLVQGLSCWLWGIPAALLLSVYELPFDWGFRRRFPVFAVAYALVLLGAIKLARVGSPGGVWRRETRRAAILAGGCLYLSPFLFFWRYGPANAWITGNLWLLMVFGVLFLGQVNRVIRPLGSYFGDAALAAEAELFRVVVYLVLGLPLLGAFGYIILAAVQAGEPVPAYFAAALAATPSWSLVLLLIPLSVTLALAWRAKDLALGVLRRNPIP